MDPTIDYITHLLGLLLLGTVLACSCWRVRERNQGDAMLLALICCGIVSCIADPLACYFDGTPGMPARAMVFVANMWLYLANVVCPAIWIAFISKHIGHNLSQPHLAAIGVLLVVAVLLLVVNLFFPIVFLVDETNSYERLAGYGYFLFVALAFVADSIAIYLLMRRRGGILKFFPIWVLIVPSVFGAVIQTVFYGISLVWPCIAITITGTVVSMQSEFMFRDKLTGLYNRFYLDNLHQRLSRSSKSLVGAMMVDLNGFKLINDTWGHSVGDEALRDTANILQDVIDADGTVVRYAGDEFVILVNTADEGKLRECEDAVHREIERFNSSRRRKLYKLSISMGGGIFDMRSTSIDEVVNQIDARMYQAKRAYYRRNDRRRS